MKNWLRRWLLGDVEFHTVYSVEVGTTVERLKLEADEVLVVKIDDEGIPLTQAMADTVKKKVEECFPNNKVLVIGSCVGFSTFKVEGG